MSSIVFCLVYFGRQKCVVIRTHSNGFERFIYRSMTKLFFGHRTPSGQRRRWERNFFFVVSDKFNLFSVDFCFGLPYVRSVCQNNDPIANGKFMEFISIEEIIIIAKRNWFSSFLKHENLKRNSLAIQFYTISSKSDQHNFHRSWHTKGAEKSIETSVELMYISLSPFTLNYFSIASKNVFVCSNRLTLIGWIDKVMGSWLRLWKMLIHATDDLAYFQCSRTESTDTLTQTQNHQNKHRRGYEEDLLCIK